MPAPGDPVGKSEGQAVENGRRSWWLLALAILAPTIGALVLYWLEPDSPLSSVLCLVIAVPICVGIAWFGLWAQKGDNRTRLVRWIPWLIAAYIATVVLRVLIGAMRSGQ